VIGSVACSQEGPGKSYRRHARLGGKIERVNPETREAELSLFVRIEGGEVTASGRAIVRFNA